MDEKKIKKRKEALLLKRESDLDVEFQECPCCDLLVANGGLGNGICREFLESLLHPRQLFMPPGKDYAFASFTSVQEAEAVVKACNGVCVQELHELNQCLPSCLIAGPPLHLYFSYISHSPSQ